jgi:thiosulfate dehydrogenase
MGAAAWAATAAQGLSGASIARDGIAAQGTPACQSCHGAAGTPPIDPDTPRIAGLDADYLRRQLRLFKTGQRRNPVMMQVASSLSPGDMATVAGYFARLPAGAAHRLAANSPGDIGTGRLIAERGRWAVNVPPCASCHAADGLGVGATAPALAGQSAAYIEAQLLAWSDGDRGGGPLGLMTGIAKRLNANDRESVAAYYHSLRSTPPDGPAPAKAPSHAPMPDRSTGYRVDAKGDATFVPPPDSEIPNDAFGAQVRLGRDIFLDTKGHAAAYVGNDLRCASCHLEAGRLPNSAPMWAAYVMYPQYRAKNGHVNSFQERLQGCFRFSMNGKAPPLGHPVLVALESYAYFLAKGAPTGVKLPGQGYPRLPAPPLAMDYSRGRDVYQANCALCHGAGGQGQSARGAVVFPPLWGPKSFNWGAGMSDIDKAAGFIEANMPLGKGYSLSTQQAWDAAAFIDSQPRPQDPRFAGSVAATRAAHHANAESMYGRTANGILLGARR